MDVFSPPWLKTSKCHWISISWWLLIIFYIFLTFLGDSTDDDEGQVIDEMAKNMTQISDTITDLVNELDDSETNPVAQDGMFLDLYVLRTWYKDYCYTCLLC